MRKQKKKQEWKSMRGIVRHRQATAKRIAEARQVVPPDIAEDPIAIMEWIRKEDRKARRRRKWE
jgi:hypothetical protein